MSQVQVRAFVETAGAPVGDRSLATWRDPVCVGVMNMAVEPARFLADRVSDWAWSLGVAVAEPGCEPNILVVLAEDGAVAARAMTAARPRDFRPGVGGMDRGMAALRRFQSSDRLVRWWSVSLPVDHTGEPIGRMPTEAPFEGGAELSHPTDFGSATTSGAAPSRLRRESRDKMMRVVVIIEAEALERADMVQISDFVALVALAQIDPDADMRGHATLLNLFAPGATPPPGLTRWDQAFLRGLYATEQNLPTARGNAGAVARETMRALSDSPD